MCCDTERDMEVRYTNLQLCTTNYHINIHHVTYSMYMLYKETKTQYQYGNKIGNFSIATLFDNFYVIYNM